jgi:hypothetical protein
VAPSSAKIGFFSETFSQCFFNEMNRPVIIQQVVEHTVKNLNSSLAECSKSDKVIHVI